MPLTDAQLIARVRRRLMQFREPADRADRFADELVKLISDEVKRRNRMYANWDAEAVAQRVREAAIESFSDLTISEEGYRQ